MHNATFTWEQKQRWQLNYLSKAPPCHVQTCNHGLRNILQYTFSQKTAHQQQLSTSSPRELWSLSTFFSFLFLSKPHLRRSFFGPQHAIDTSQGWTVTAWKCEPPGDSRGRELYYAAITRLGRDKRPSLTSGDTTSHGSILEQTLGQIRNRFHALSLVPFWQRWGI